MVSTFEIEKPTINLADRLKLGLLPEDILRVREVHSISLLDKTSQIFIYFINWAGVANRIGKSSFDEALFHQMENTVSEEIDYLNQIQRDLIERISNKNLNYRDAQPTMERIRTQIDNRLDAIKKLLKTRIQ